MYKPIYSQYSEKGRILLLLDKRNKQFSDTFKKLRDPVSILQFYNGMNQVFEKYFVDVKKSEQWIKLLVWVYDKGFFFIDEAMKELGITRKEMTSILMSMNHRHLLTVKKGQMPHLYSLSSEGYLFLQNFSKECVSEMMKVIRNGRKGRKKYKP